MCSISWWNFGATLFVSSVPVCNCTGQFILDQLYVVHTLTSSNKPRRFGKATAGHQTKCKSTCLRSKLKELTRRNKGYEQFHKVFKKTVSKED